MTTGRASYVGVSNYAGWQMAQAATWQRAVPGRAPLASNQVEYSLLNRAVEHERGAGRPRARTSGLLAWSPLGRGVLTGKYRSGTPGRLARRLAALRQLRRAPTSTPRAARSSRPWPAPPTGCEWSPLEVALAWVRDRPGVASALVGARTAAQLRGSLTAEQCVLPDEIRTALDDVSSR